MKHIEVVIKSREELDDFIRVHTPKEAEHKANIITALLVTTILAIGVLMMLATIKS